MLLQIWCCSGNRRYLALNQSVFADATAVLLVYDTTDASSFEELIFWYNEAQVNLRNCRQLNVKKKKWT